MTIVNININIKLKYSKITEIYLLRFVGLLIIRTLQMFILRDSLANNFFVKNVQLCSCSYQITCPVWG